MDRSVWNVLKCLATSRKVWLAGIGAGAALVLYIQGAIDADKLASTLVALATAVILAIAAEDSAASIGAGPQHVTKPGEWPVCAECGAPATAVSAGPTWHCDAHAPWDAIDITVEEVA